jgi:hypothetical protein
MQFSPGIHQTCAENAEQQPGVMIYAQSSMEPTDCSKSSPLTGNRLVEDTDEN